MSRRHISVKNRPGIYYSLRADDSRMYEVRYRDSLGKDRFDTKDGTLLSLQDALDHQADIRVRMGRGEKVAPTKKTLADVAEEWQEMLNVAPATRAQYEVHLRKYILPALGRHKIRRITTDQVALFVRNLPPELAGSTKQTILSTLTHVFNFAVNPRRGYLPQNPVIGLERGERPKAEEFPPRVLGPGETERLLAALKDDWARAIVQTALLTGMRIGEILGLKWKDVDFEKGEIHIRGSIDDKGWYGPTKGRSHRDVPLLPGLRQILWEYPTRFKGPESWVFQRVAGGSIARSVVTKRFMDARKAAGLPEFPRPLRFHDLRHTYASVLLQNGNDIVWVSKLLGHSSTHVTMERYAHVIFKKDREKDAQKRLGAALGSWASGGGHSS